MRASVLQKFRSLSIKNKLIIITMLVSIVSLLVACTAFIAIDALSFRRKIAGDYTIFAKVIGGAASEVLQLKDPEGANEILLSIKENRHIVSAVLYDSEGKVLGQYHREGWPFTEPDLKKDGDYFLESHLVIFHTVKLRDIPIGKVYLNTDLQGLATRFKGYAAVVSLILIVGLSAAFFISHKLQSVISDPIRNLAEVAKRVSEQKDYSLRAEYDYRDEIGLLISGFNDMLDQILIRDMALTQSKNNLEDLVKMRTTTLEDEIRSREEGEERLRTFSEKLQQRNRELQDFAHISSHDLQEPLRKVIVFGTRLKGKYAHVLDVQGKDYLDRILNGTHRMQGLITDLLTFSRLTEHVHPFVPVDLSKVAHETLSVFGAKLEETGGSVHLGALPTVDADPVHMHQLFHHLIENALKFRRPGEAPKVKIGGEVLLGNGKHSSIGNLLKISINDNGIGFDQKYIDRIFKVFQRLHDRTEYEGNGIGLALCQKIVEHHGGSITAKSTPGQGATFIVWLPLNQRPAGGL